MTCCSSLVSLICFLFSSFPYRYDIQWGIKHFEIYWYLYLINTEENEGLVLLQYLINSLVYAVFDVLSQMFRVLDVPMIFVCPNLFDAYCVLLLLFFPMSFCFVCLFVCFFWGRFFKCVQSYFPFHHRTK